MDARDFRGLGRPAQEELRRRALFLVEHEGMTQAEAARAVGAHRRAYLMETSDIRHASIAGQSAPLRLSFHTAAP